MKTCLSFFINPGPFVIGIVLSLVVPVASATEIQGGASGIFASGLPANAHSISLHGPDIHMESDDAFGFYTENGFPDGRYRYEVKGTARQVRSVSARSNLENGRDKGARPSQIITRTVESGVFNIVNGHVHVPDASMRER